MSLNDAESSTQGEADVRWSRGTILLGSRQQGPPKSCMAEETSGAAGLDSWLCHLLIADLLIKESNVVCCRFSPKVNLAE